MIKHYWETTKHKLWVLFYTTKFCYSLMKRALFHDVSKYKKIEAKHFAREVPKLEKLTYGSEEYKKSLKRLGKALEHHYKNNSHHPEYHDVEELDFSPVSLMNILDFIEMVVDWKSSTKRHEDGDIEESIEINTEEYDIKPNLKLKIKDIIRVIE